VVLGCDSVDSAPENEEYLSIHTPIFSRLIPVLLEAYERGEFSPASILGETPSLVYYVTGNENKAKELNALLSENEKLASTLVIKRKDIDLDEIQGSSEEIATDKASRGAQILRAPVIVEDVSLCFDALNGLPGPYIKWFIKQLGTDGIYDMISRYEDRTTRARCTMAYEPFAPPSQEMKEEEPSSPSSALVVVGEVEGTAVAPRGDRAFGWDPLFMPQGFDRTFSEMDKAEKNSISHRKRAVSLLMDHLVEAFHL
jgi:inosine triphosphate pyrophosphatase